jgi:hypothetical protein
MTGKERDSMESKGVRASRLWLWGLALLSLVGCGRSVAVGEPVILRAGQSVRVPEAGLTIRVERVVSGQPGSQDPEDGAVELRVMVRGGGEQDLFVPTGLRGRIGGYEIYLERLILDSPDLGCELVVRQP